MSSLEALLRLLGIYLIVIYFAIIWYLFFNMDFSVDFLTKTVSTGEDELKLQIWDTAGYFFYFLFYFILF